MWHVQGKICFSVLHIQLWPTPDRPAPDIVNLKMEPVSVVKFNISEIPASCALKIKVCKNLKLQNFLAYKAVKCIST